ncbi:hypothetical protein K2Y11_02175 [bacterium]|nr:hypothetical protein [bacterium]
MVDRFRQFFSAAVVTLLAVAFSAEAHFIWFEAVPTPEGTTLKAGFGEKGAWETEYAPSIEKATYWVVRDDGQSEPVSFVWDKKQECYIAFLPKEAGAAAYGKLTWGIFARDGVPPSLLYYYPKILLGTPDRWNGAKPSADSNVEILIKLEGSTVKFQALAQGKPMPDAKVKFYTPDATEPEVVTADKEGKGEWKVEGPGTYSVTVVDRRKVGGEHEGKKFVGEMHCASLVFTVPDTKGTTAAK